VNDTLAVATAHDERIRQAERERLDWWQRQAHEQGARAERSEEIVAALRELSWVAYTREGSVDEEGHQTGSVDVEVCFRCGEERAAGHAADCPLADTLDVATARDERLLAAEREPPPT
jgi:hypothetical protein